MKVENFEVFLENLLAKVGDPLLVKIFTAFVTLDVNLVYWIGFDKEVEDNKHLKDQTDQPGFFLLKE